MEKELVYSGRTTASAHKGDDWATKELSDNVSKAVRKVTILDAQWSDCPIEVCNEIEDLWRMEEFGNDNYVSFKSINDLISYQDEGTLVDKWVEEGHPTNDAGYGWIKAPISFEYTIDYLRKQGILDDETVWIHWWW